MVPVLGRLNKVPLLQFQIPAEVFTTGRAATTQEGSPQDSLVGKMVKALEESPMRKIRIEKLTLNICVGEVNILCLLFAPQLRPLH